MGDCGPDTGEYFHFVSSFLISIAIPLAMYVSRLARMIDVASCNTLSQILPPSVSRYGIRLHIRNSEQRYSSALSAGVYPD